MSCKCHPPATYSQSLEEMDFERSIHNAAHKNNIQKVEIMPDQLVNIYDNSGYLPLHYAARQGHLEMAKLLIRKGACVNAKTRNGGVSVLHRACISGNVELVEYLIQKGADKEAVDRDGRTVYDIAVANEDVMIKLKEK
ncbi:hypothetical protein HDV01_003630 [Terramyces sp. JEL0728]|nr:hypothetical protein HDV01_003630 [Terramyces sp. JEL0728]